MFLHIMSFCEFKTNQKRNKYTPIVGLFLILLTK